MLNIDELLKRLSSKRPIFHSEADFQHALAWEIHKQHSRYNIRLEYKPPNIRSRIYTDIWVIGRKTVFAIELKYKTRPLHTNFNSEYFSLLNQGAQDIGRYDYLKDIQRLERVVGNKKQYIGHAIFLTNDRTYWKDTSRKNTVDKDFRIYEARVIKGSLGWGKHASKGTMRRREVNINLNSLYKVAWKDYSKPSNKPNGSFRYLHFKIKK